jgi:acetyl-CoA acyltransferase
MKSERIEMKGKNGRVAIVATLRTPFARIGTHFRDLNPIELGAMAVSELLARNNLAPDAVDQCVFGQTVMMPDAPFIAREIVLATGMSPYTDAYSITRACATSFQTVASAADNILLGYSDVSIAGGVDSTSSVRIPLSEKLSATLRDANFAKGAGAKLKLLSALRPKDLIPTPPSITEYSTGMTMGQNAEQMVKAWGVTREEQDDIAHASQQCGQSLGRGQNAKRSDDGVPERQGPIARCA